MTKAGERMIAAAREMVTMETQRRENERYATALRAIIARADTDKPGTSKVQDIRRLAAEALGEG